MPFGGDDVDEFGEWMTYISMSDGVGVWTSRGGVDLINRLVAADMMVRERVTNPNMKRVPRSVAGGTDH